MKKLTVVSFVIKQVKNMGFQNTAFTTVFLLVWIASPAGAFPPEWAANIRRLCNEFDNHPLCVFMDSLVPTCVDGSQTPLSLVMPPIMLWSPHEQFQSISFSCPTCDFPSNKPKWLERWKCRTINPKENPWDLCNSVVSRKGILCANKDMKFWVMNRAFCPNYRPKTWYSFYYGTGLVLLISIR